MTSQASRLCDISFEPHGFNCCKCSVFVMPTFLHRNMKMDRDPTTAVLGRKPLRSRILSGSMCSNQIRCGYTSSIAICSVLVSASTVQLLALHRPGKWLPDWQDTNIRDDN